MLNLFVSKLLTQIKFALKEVYELKLKDFLINLISL